MKVYTAKIYDHENKKENIVHLGLLENARDRQKYQDEQYDKLLGGFYTDDEIFYYIDVDELPDGRKYPEPGDRSDFVEIREIISLDWASH